MHNQLKQMRWLLHKQNLYRDPLKESACTSTSWAQACRLRTICRTSLRCPTLHFEQNRGRVCKLGPGFSAANRKNPLKTIQNVGNKAHALEAKFSNILASAISGRLCGKVASVETNSTWQRPLPINLDSHGVATKVLDWGSQAVPLYSVKS